MFSCISVFSTNLSTFPLWAEEFVYTHWRKNFTLAPESCIVPTQTHHSQCKQLLCKERMSKTKEGLKRNGWNKRKADYFTGNYWTATVSIVLWACPLGTHDFLPVRFYPGRQETPTPQKTLTTLSSSTQHRTARLEIMCTAAACVQNTGVPACESCVGLKHGLLRCNVIKDITQYGALWFVAQNSWLSVRTWGNTMSRVGNWVRAEKDNIKMDIC